MNHSLAKVSQEADAWTNPRQEEARCQDVHQVLNPDQPDLSRPQGQALVQDATTYEETSKMDQTKYYAYHMGPRHATNDYTIWMKYLEKLVKEGKWDQYVNRLATRPRRETDVDAEHLVKTIQINGIFSEFEHLGATNSSSHKCSTWTDFRFH